MVLYHRRVTVPGSLLKIGLGVQLFICLLNEHLHRNLKLWFARNFYQKGAEIFSGLISLFLCHEEYVDVCQFLLFQPLFLYILM